MSEQIKAFGLRDVKMAEIITDNETETTYGEFVQAVGIKSFSCDPIIEEFELTGDDTILEADASLMGYEFSCENAVLTFEQLKILTGAVYEDIMNELGEKIGEVSYSTRDDRLPYFGLVGRVRKDGTLKRILYKCRATGGVSITYQEKDYALVTFSGKALARNSDGRFMATKKVNKEEPISADDLI